MLVVMLMQAEAALASLDPEELPALSGSGQGAGAEPEGRGGRGSAGAQPEQAPLQGHDGMPSKGLSMVRSLLIMVPDVLVSTCPCAIAAGTFACASIRSGMFLGFSTCQMSAVYWVIRRNPAAAYVDLALHAAGASDASDSHQQAHPSTSGQMQVHWT